MKMLSIYILMVIVLFPGACVAETVFNEPLGFSFSLPKGYVLNEVNADQRGVLYTFGEGAVDSKDGRIVIQVMTLGGVMGRDEPSEILESMGTVTEDVSWRSFDLKLARADIEANGWAIVTMFIQVPLEPEAIQVSVGAPLQREAQAKEALVSVLKSIDGTTNWVASGQRLRAFLTGYGVTLLLRGIPLILILALLCRGLRGRGGPRLPLVLRPVPAGIAVCTLIFVVEILAFRVSGKMAFGLGPGIVRHLLSYLLVSIPFCLLYAGLVRSCRGSGASEA